MSELGRCRGDPRATARVIDRLSAERGKETVERVELSTGNSRRAARWPGAAKREANVRTSSLIVCLLIAAIAPAYALSLIHI